MEKRCTNFFTVYAGTKLETVYFRCTISDQSRLRICKSGFKRSRTCSLRHHSSRFSKTFRWMIACLAGYRPPETFYCPSFFILDTKILTCGWKEVVETLKLYHIRYLTQSLLKCVSLKQVLNTFQPFLHSFQIFSDHSTTSWEKGDLFGAYLWGYGGCKVEVEITIPV